MKKYLLIAEKPSLMRDINSTYKKHITDINSKVGEIDFIALAGHVCRLIQPKEYPDWDIPWKDIDLPMIPPTFKIAPIASSKNIISDVKKKLKENHYDGIIVATDADVEGNGIYYLLAEYLNLKKIPALRYFINDQTDGELYKSFLNMTDFWSYPRDVNMTNAFLIRSHLDWLIGMNFTVGASLNSNATLRVGRVKTPTLKLVYDNCEAIDNFTSTTDYSIDAIYKEGFNGSLLNDEDKVRKFKTKKDAEDYYAKLSKTGIIKEITKKTEKTAAPQLYNLSDLQTDAGAKFGYSPAKTLEIVQSLYETHKIVSYPRTDGRYVSTEKAKEFPNLLKTVTAFPELKEWVEKITSSDIKRAQTSKRTVNDAEVAKSSHDALLPTVSNPNISKLSEDEKNVCLLIYKRFIAQFMTELIEEKTTMLVDIDEDTFRSTGKETKDCGWTVLYDKKTEDKKLPHFKKGDKLTVDEYLTVENTTQPPKRYTQATLINAMVNISKYIEDKGMKKIMKTVSGLGTQASRASIISDLIKEGYMEEKGSKKNKYLYITETGKLYIERLKNYDIVKPELTAEWETKMQEIKEGSGDFNKINKEMLEFVKTTVKDLEKAPKITASFNSSKKSTGLKCPLCEKEIKKGPYGWYCAGKLDKSCTFSIPLNIASKKITDANIKSLINKSKTGVIKGFKSKTGKSFDAILVLKNGKTEFEFPKK